MGFLKMIFGGKRESEKAQDKVKESVQQLVQSELQTINMQVHQDVPKEQKKVVTVPISQVTSIPIPEGSTIIAESEIPASCCMGNLVFEKKYQEAIDLGLKLLMQTPNDCGVHINLMDAYFKGRDLSPEYLDKSTYHAKKSILLGHHTGYAEERLAKNLDKAKLYHQSLQLYNLILDNDGFHFSPTGCGNYIDFAKRRETILKKMDKALDTEDDILFTPEEIAKIIQDIKDDDQRIRDEQLSFQRRHAKDKQLLKKLEDAFKRRDYDEFDQIHKELNALLFS